MVFYDVLFPDSEDTCHVFEIEGGIWVFNNRNQDSNPLWTRKYDSRHFQGHTMFFYNVRNFRLSNMKFKDPLNYAVTIDTGSYFTAENTIFDFNFGNPITELLTASISTTVAITASLKTSRGPVMTT